MNDPPPFTGEVDGARSATDGGGAPSTASRFPSPGNGGGFRRRAVISEIPFLLLLLHRRVLVVVDDAALAFGGAGGEHFGDDLFQGHRGRLDRTRQRIAAERAEAHQLHLRR